MHRGLKTGDFLIVQLEAGYAMLRLLAIDESEPAVFHVAAFSDFFLEVDNAEAAAANFSELKRTIPHVALTQRAFESTQAAPIANSPISHEELELLNRWNDSEQAVSDTSIRLLLGLR
jgi:hypothetical protein